mmetsp:Transcript_71238/g.230675  ORF Transcript_71238/g.230675 Transcript_71238/m.230675 type:complete len:409 (-) Transcript_71238:363-1589(-)
MKSFDAFARPVQEFRVKTTCGGYLSVCSFCLIFALFVTELRYFLQFDTKDEMLIDQNQDQKYLNITIDVTFPQAPCAVLHMNLLDPKRANVMHVVHEVYKTRLAPAGGTLGRKLRDSLLNVAQTTAEVAAASSSGASVRTSHATTHLRCHSCFQSHLDEDDCCSSCEDVRREFRARSWDERPAEYVFSQCAEEAYARDGPQEQEGCRIEAKLHVRKVPATLHIGIGRHLRAELLRLPLQEEKRLEVLQSVDFSHRISKLSFGPHFPGLVSVLDGRQKANHTLSTSEHYQYDIHVIPTRYEQDGEPPVVSHQYSVTEYGRTVDPALKHQDAPALGLWFSYDFTPFEVKVTRGRKSIWHFLTECCAILGGIFAFTGMLDNAAYSINKSLVAAGSRKVGVRTQLASMDTRG